MRNSSRVAVGQTIAGKYVLERVLGEGGMGVVYAAMHLGLEQRVAIKLLLNEDEQLEQQILERFQREARAAARIRSEHVCRVLDTGRLDDGSPFLVMEYLEGCDFHAELARRGRFELREAVAYMREACAALAEAHANGIVHRDLKPANLFLTQRASGTRYLKVLDFGVSKLLAPTSSQPSLTRTAAMVGSPIYMSPEQLQSARDVDTRTDLWALGAILYELITGRPPFDAESMPQLVQAVLNADPVPLASLHISAPAGFERVLLRALEKDRRLRYESAEAFSAALAPFDGQLGVSFAHTLHGHALSLLAAPHADGLGEVRAPQTALHTLPPPAVSGRHARMVLMLLGLICLSGIAAALTPHVVLRSIQAPPYERRPAAVASPTAQPSGSLSLRSRPHQPAAPPAIGSQQRSSGAGATDLTTDAPVVVKRTRAVRRGQQDQPPSALAAPEAVKANGELPDFGGRH